MKLHLSALAAACVFAAASVAQANSVTAKLNNVTSEKGSLTWGAQHQNPYKYVGALTWSNVSISTPLDAAGTAFKDFVTANGGTFQSFCIEGNQDVYLNTNNTFSVLAMYDVTNAGQAATAAAALALLPTGSTSGSLPKIGSAGPAVVNLARAHFAQLNLASSLSADRDNVAAYQLALWELVYDGLGSGLGRFGTGSLKAATASSGTERDISLAAIGTADNWLENLGTAPLGNVRIYVLTDSSKQDQLVFERLPTVPLPAALPAGAALLGALGVSYGLRKRS